MTPDGAMPLEQLPPPPAGWISPSTAAQVLGKTARSIRRWCEAGRLTAALCRVGDASEWRIDPASKPSLALASGYGHATPAMPGDPLLSLSDRKRGDLLGRWEILQAWDKAQAERPQGYTGQQWMDLWCRLWTSRHPERPLSRRTLYVWISQRRAGGIAALADRRGGFVRHEPDGYLWQVFRGLVLGENRETVAQAYRITTGEAARLGLEWPTLRTVQRWYNERIAPIERAAGREVKRFEDRFVPYVARDWTQVPAMGCWVADNRVLDLFYRYQAYDGRFGRHVWRRGRPWVQSWLDARSWYPAAFEVYGEEPDASETAALFAAGVSLHGAPDEALVDNGSGFRAEAFSGGRPNRADADEARVNPVMAELGVKLVRFAQPWNHKAKPIEPWFKLVSAEFDRLWWSYLGYSTSVRPGEADAIPVEQLPTLQQIRELFGAWIQQTYSRLPSPAAAAAGLSPLRAFTELREEGREFSRPSDEVLCLLCLPSVPVRVEQNGVYVKRWENWYWHPSLVERQGSGRDAKRKVTYRCIPGRPERVFVFDEQGRYLCAAEPWAGAGMNPLIDPERRPEEAERLGRVLEIRNAISKHYSASASDARSFAGNALLAAQNAGLAAVGGLDLAARAPEPPANIRISPHLEAGAASLAREADGSAEADRRDARTARQKMMDFLGTARVGPDPETPVRTQGQIIEDLLRRKKGDSTDERDPGGTPNEQP